MHIYKTQYQFSNLHLNNSMKTAFQIVAVLFCHAAVHADAIKIRSDHDIISK